MDGREEARCDFLIVGAGSAGCVLANRLSADPTLQVILVEAGPNDNSWLIRTPAAVGALIRHRTYNWNYATVPQKQLGNRRLPMPRGRVLGGTSSINGMVYIRGHAHDFDDWAADCGSDWDYAHLLPYFIRSECNSALTDPALHGRSGPMHVTSIRPYNRLCDRFLEAAESQGYPRCRDFNGPETEGFGDRQATIRAGRRESMATAFLRPALRRPNLRVMTDCLVHRVFQEAGRACGIEFRRDGVVQRLSARREIIVCGGAFGSPALLLRSGIGSSQALQSLGITPRCDNPQVGQNLCDHLSTSIAMRTRNTDSYGLSWRALPRNAWHLLNYLVRSRGPLGSNVFEAHGFIRTRPDLDAPDLQIIFMPAWRNPSGFPIPLGHGYGINVALLSPRSRGSVALASPDPDEAPLIDPNFLSDPVDLSPLVYGLKLARRLLAAPAFRAFRAHEVLPGPSATDDAALEVHIRSTCGTVFHPAGTCRMGSDTGSVLDSQLRVRGVDGLRVVDASVFPGVIRGNTNAAVVMVAEKAADMILGRPAPPPATPQPTAERLVSNLTTR